VLSTVIVETLVGGVGERLYLETVKIEIAHLFPFIAYLIGSQKIRAGLSAPREGKSVVFPSLTDRTDSLWLSIRAPLTGAIAFNFVGSPAWTSYDPIQVDDFLENHQRAPYGAPDR
jgi:hypothetical protein